MKYLKINIILAFAACICSSLLGMQPPPQAGQKRPVETEEENAAKRYRNLPSITLKATDGKTFTIPLPIAERAITLKEFMEDTNYSKENLIPISPVISSTLLQAVADVMWIFYDHHESVGKELLDAMDNDWKTNAVSKTVKDFDLWKAFNYLNFKPGLLWIERLYAQKVIKASQLRTAASIKQLQEFIRKNLDEQTANAYFTGVARYYYLLTGKDLPGITDDNYGFSVREYFEYQPGFISSRFITENSQLVLDLMHMRINNLDGLTIPETKSVDILKLGFNLIREIPAHVFMGFENLKELDLENLNLNPVEKIQFKPECFKDLPALITLNLSSNGITNVSEIVTIINADLPHLEILNLSNNGITEMQPNSFAGYTNLKYLNLERNKLITLTQEALIGLINLEWLSLAGNKLETIAFNAFNGTTNVYRATNVLKKINLSSNSIASLPSVVFDELENLEELSLAHNQLKNLPGDIFKNNKKLVKLFLQFNSFRKLSPTLFVRLYKLKNLALWNNPVSEDNKKELREALTGRETIIRFQAPDIKDEDFTEWE